MRITVNIFKGKEMTVIAPTYCETLDMAYVANGLKPLNLTGGCFTGYAVANDLGFGETVGGGAALMLGGSLVFKTAKGIVWVPKWTYQNYGNYRNALRDAKTGWIERNFGANVKAKRQLFMNGVKGSGFWGGFANANKLTELQSLENELASKTGFKIGFSKKKYLELRKAGKTKEATAYLKKFKDPMKAKLSKINCYKKAKQLLKEINAGRANGTLKGQDLRNAISKLDKELANADKEALKFDVKPTSRLGKIKAGLGKYTGAKALNGALTKGAASESMAIRGASKAAKGFVKGGGALTAAIEFGLEVPDIIKTFRECGTTSGWKQVGKSATVAVASGAGYAAGAWAGGKLGAAIGSCFGPLGTVVGGVIGVACGLATSWLCSTLAKKAVGKSELDKKKETDALNTAREAKKDPEKMKELLAAYESVINNREEMLAEGIEDNTNNNQEYQYIYEQNSQPANFNYLS
jgi:hypothetical protein